MVLFPCVYLFIYYSPSYIPLSQSVQAVFRSLASLEKTVEKCHIELDEQKNRLTFTLHCKHGISASLPPQMVHSIYTDTHFLNCSTSCIHCIVRYMLAYSKCLCCVLPAGLLKTHNLSFQDSESLQAVFDKDNYANVFRSHPRSVKSFYILCDKNNGNLTVFLSLSLSPSVMFGSGFPFTF